MHVGVAIDLTNIGIFELTVYGQLVREAREISTQFRVFQISRLLD